MVFLYPSVKKQMHQYNFANVDTSLKNDNDDKSADFSLVT